MRYPGTSFILRNGDDLIGAVLGGSDGRRGYVHHLAVHPAWQGKGWGRQLLQRVLDAFRSMGVPKVHLFVLRENRRAIAFYDHLGWSLREDLDLMSLTLEPTDHQRVSDDC